jgi:excisionase family DNA binding protein
MRAAASSQRARLSLGPASRLLGVDPDTLRRWADDGRIETFTTPGGHRRFDSAEIERVLTTRRQVTPGARSLASMGATPDRLSRAYRRNYSAETPGRRARNAVPIGDREAFRADGRALVSSLVAYLDAATPAERAAAESSADQLIEGLSRRLAGAGLSLTESVELFVARRKPFLAELGVVARRRALDASRLSALFEEASALLDRMLLRLIAAYQEIS